MIVSHSNICFVCLRFSTKRKKCSFCIFSKKAIDKQIFVCYNSRVTDHDLFHGRRRHDGPVVQLVRTLACHARGRGFESHPGRHIWFLLWASINRIVHELKCLFASVAQSVEQGTENPRVVGSIPTGGTKAKHTNSISLFVWLCSSFFLSFITALTVCAVPASSFDYGVCAYLIVSSMKQSRFFFADLAHLVERHLAKVEVAGSSPVIRSNMAP